MADDSLDLTEELPELEGVALEAPTMPSIQAPVFTPAAPAPAAAPADTEQFSASDLSNDIFGGADFDLPPPPPAASASAPKPISPAAPPSFKPPTALFGQSGGFGTSGLKPTPITPKAAAAAVAQPLAAAPSPIDTRSMMTELNSDSKDALRVALTSETAPAQLPDGLQTALLHLARVLIKNGVVAVDDLLL